MNNSTLALVDIKRLDNERFECAYCAYTKDADFSFAALLQFSTLDKLKQFIKNLQEEYFVVVNYLDNEFKSVFQNPIVDLQYYGCPNARNPSEDDGEFFPCELHREEKHKCALWHNKHMHDWLIKESNIMRIVCACINKYRSSGGLESFNDFDWCYMSAHLLILLAGDDLPRLWSILPEEFKKEHPEYEYCYEHHINSDSNATCHGDDPPSIKKNCLVCQQKKVEGKYTGTTCCD